MSRELLEWYVAMGADEAVTDVPSPIVSVQKTMTPPSQSTSPPPVTTTPAMPGLDAIIASARSAADACETVEALKQAVLQFDGCALKKTATNTVFCDGNSKAKVMMIGEAPGANEDIQGVPFCGDSGKLLDLLLGSIGLSRAENIYITNSVFWRPPGNRRPTDAELAMCAPFVERHITLMNPKLIILAGSTAVASVLHDNSAVSKLRQKFHEYKDPYTGNTIPVAILFHPAYLLRQPSQKRLMWQDLLKIKHALKAQAIL